MYNRNIEVSDETRMLVNINTIVDSLYSELLKHFEKYELDKTLTEPQQDIEYEKWRESMNDIFGNIRSYVREKIHRSVDDSLDEVTYTI